MYHIGLTYRKTLQSTFDKLLDKIKLLKASRPLTSAALQKIKEAISIEWTYNSNSIEGNSLTLRETQLVLQEGVTIKGKSLREHFEAKNHDISLNHLYVLATPNYQLSSRDILSLHGYVLRTIADDFAGRLRNGGVRISGGNFIPPNARKVSQLLDDLVDFVNTNSLGLNMIELVTIFHHKFVRIHPFFDGNGRTVRLTMNLILISKGIPPAIILKNDRQKYDAALYQANTGNYQKLMLLMSQALERTLNIYLSVLPSNDLEYDTISSIVEEPEIPYGQEYVSLLARQVKIDAHKEGRNWYTTKEAVLEYMKSK